jgi:hypothetical protein
VTEDLEKLAIFSPQYKAEEFWLANSGIKTVLDVGAHVGEFAELIRTILPNAELVCFEPYFIQAFWPFTGKPKWIHRLKSNQVDFC